MLSEGQNLQDGAIVVNFDLPWAIIRLVQRAGRVDRIGQKAEEILCYTFIPADGVDRIIDLRRRVQQRLSEAGEVLGTDETFFEDSTNRPLVQDLYNEKAGILDGDDDTEVDLGSFAFQIWKNAIDRDPALQKIIPDLPPVVYSTKTHSPAPGQPEGILAYVRTSEGNDALAWLDKAGCAVTESQFAILKAAECQPDSPLVPRHANHHELVAKAVALIAKEEKTVGGQLGRPSGARFRILRVYDTARDLRDGQVPVIGGFHTPNEKESLDLLLRGTQPVVVCPARSLQGMRVPSVWKTAINAGRLLVLSQFAERHRRVTAELSAQRNRLVAALAAEIFVAHAAPGSKTEDLCDDRPDKRKVNRAEPS